MKGSLSITKYIIECLKTNSELIDMISEGGIYPLDALEGAKFPFVVIIRNTITPAYCKDGVYSDDMTVSIIIVARTYIDSVNIAEAVRETLEFKKFTDDETGYEIKNIKLSSASEDIYNNVYIQRLDFEVDA